MSHSVTVVVDGKEYNYMSGLTLQNISRDFQAQYDHAIILARVDGSLSELSDPVDKDCQIEFITTGSQIGMQTYKRTCRMVLIKAFEDVLGRDHIHRLSVLYSVGDGLYCELDADEPVSEELIARVRQQMEQIVQDKIDFIRKTVPMSEALDIFREYGKPDKMELFYYRRSKSVSYYMLDKTIDYLYGYMAPDTSYARYFDLVKYDDGFILQLPDVKEPEFVPPVKPEPKLFQVFKESKHWSRLLDVRTVADLNRVISQGRFSQLVLVQEALMEKTIADVASRIVEKGRRVVLIAGPSSSGKTTFSHRLSIQLIAQGLKPHPVAVDNYFVDREMTPVDENGNYDFECLEALDVKRLNEDIAGLLAGEKVSMPVFNFVSGKREEPGTCTQIGKDDVLVIEGIHSLNDQMTYSLDADSKYKIYISALTQLSIDDHSRLPTTDVRLIRRMCRDAAHRGASASRTLSMWQSVRKGEEKNIFPYQEQCDFMFNSALIYELAVLKQTVEPLLFQIRPDDPEYDEGKRLLKFLTYLLGAGSEAIPHNSIIREFIGGSCFDVG